jgi:opacity protein-like surface antigen
MRNKLLGVAFAVALAAPLHAQTMVPGAWTGTLSGGPNGESVPLTFDVKVEHDTLKIALVTPDGRSFPFANVRFEEKNLRFDIGPNNEGHCLLNPTPMGGYKGDCTADDGTGAALEMVPPKP